MLVTNETKQKFRSRHGLDTLPAHLATKGVAANWSALKAHVENSRVAAGMKLIEPPPQVHRAGLASRTWSWSGPHARFSVTVFVVGEGSGRAREHFVELGTTHSMLDDPYSRTKTQIGDLSLSIGGVPPTSIAWLYYNTCVQVDDFGTGADLERIAGVIQAFMEPFLVADFTPQIPAVKAVASTARVTEGDVVTIDIQLGARTGPLSFAPSVREQYPTLLEPTTSDADGLKHAFRAVTPGSTRLEVLVVDASNLLSPTVSLPLEVIPGGKQP